MKKKSGVYDNGTLSSKMKIKGCTGLECNFNYIISYKVMFMYFDVLLGATKCCLVYMYTYQLTWLHNQAYNQGS